jgi:inhibitor of cysteine peptidase
MACLGLFLSLNCVPSFAQKSSLPKFTLTKKDSGKTITLRVGDKIAIKLAASISTGFSWNIKQTAPNILKCLGSQYVQGSAQPNSVGATGNQVFLFQAQKLGTAHLNLKQWLVFKSKKSNISQFNATISVAHAH